MHVFCNGVGKAGILSLRIPRGMAVSVVTALERPSICGII